MAVAVSQTIEMRKGEQVLRLTIVRVGAKGVVLNGVPFPPSPR